MGELRRFYQLDTPCYPEWNWLYEVNGEYYGKEILLEQYGKLLTKWEHCTGLAEVYPKTGGDQLWGTFDPNPADDDAVWELITGGA